ncbi:MAG TPA: DUF2927 domain-containing protein [Thermohalobaculum sp.]|nr:DUF2927 domain-containing protein [Thermohalobaculum sp.]
MPGPTRHPALCALLIAALATLAGCAGRPSAKDYAAYESMLQVSGKLRTETAPADAPYDAADLARNFARIALAREADPARPGGYDNYRPSPLRRWHGPIRYRLHGGAVTPEDRAETARLMTRVAGLTGLDIAEAEQGPGQGPEQGPGQGPGQGTEQETNFLILITTPDERDRIAAWLAERVPQFQQAFRFWRQQRNVICVADNLPLREHPDLIGAAMVVIGAETTGLLRRACLHEEVVQALGLANDHPAVRPSVFNDDGEFALLTEHDELLLRMLYDHRLAPGMTAAEALPLTHRIARELVPGAGGITAREPRSRLPSPSPQPPGRPPRG